MNEPDGEQAAQLAVSTLSLDQVFDLLAERRRRLALYELHDRSDGVATLGGLAAGVARLEGRLDGEARSEDEIALSLLHVHLPKLESVGIVDLDRRSETVRYWRHPSMDEWLEHAFHIELE